jgi:hypothetical protein
MFLVATNKSDHVMQPLTSDNVQLHWGMKGLAWYAEFLLEIDLDILLTGARLILKI